MKQLIRKNILNLKPYSSARDEFSGEAKIFLDANENPYGELNRYPDPYQRKLKARLVELKPVQAENIFIGNGSDEVIDLAFRIFCEPGVDKALTFSPTYGMYDVSAGINDIDLMKVPLDDSFQVDTTALEKFIDDPNLKLIFLCSPNNPTGNIISDETIDWILDRFNGILIIDEAYMDFSETASNINRVSEQSSNRLIVIQTFSKAWGLAAARVGAAYANAEIIELFNRVKPPYNVSALNQKAALEALNDFYGYRANKCAIMKQRTWMVEQLTELELVKKIYPSEANFLLIKVGDANDLYEYLIENEVVVRNRNNIIDNCLRITIGSPEENQRLMKSLSSYQAIELSKNLTIES